MDENLYRQTSMEYAQRMVTGPQARAARGLLDINQRELARLATVPLSSVKSFESGRDVRMSVVTAIEGAFVRAGLLFLDPGDARVGGRGLRWRDDAAEQQWRTRPREKSRQERS
jgi:hypothetical protein